MKLCRFDHQANEEGLRSSKSEEANKCFQEHSIFSNELAKFPPRRNFRIDRRLFSDSIFGENRWRGKRVGSVCVESFSRRHLKTFSIFKDKDWKIGKTCSENAKFGLKIISFIWRKRRPQFKYLFLRIFRKNRLEPNSLQFDFWHRR